MKRSPHEIDSEIVNSSFWRVRFGLPNENGAQEVPHRRRGWSRFWFPSAIILLLCFAWAQAQIFTGISQGPTRLDAATFLYTNGATACTTAAQTAATDTVTIPAPQGQGQFVYITGFYAHVSQNATGTGDTQAITISASNLTAVSGAAPVWDLNTVVNTTGGSTITYSESYPPGALKATAPNTAVVFTPSATQGTNEFLCYRVAGFYAN